MKITTAENQTFYMIYVGGSSKFDGTYFRTVMPFTKYAASWYKLEKNDLIKLNDEDASELEDVLLVYIGGLADIIKEKGE